MSDTPIHFIGFLVNVDNSILKLNLGNNFVIEKLPQEKVKRLLDAINKFRSYHDANAIRILPEYYCVTKQQVTKFQETEQGGVVIKVAESEKIKHEIRNKIRLLRLFKEGNIFLQSLCLYHIKGTIPKVISSIDEWPIIDKTIFKLADNEVSQVELFVNEIKIPFPQKFLQLAFDSFEWSYGTDNLGLAFLSLMISLESMLNIDKYELRYRTSRNAAILLGENQEKAEQIFKEIRNLYDKRSALVHTGDPRAINLPEVLMLRDYVRKAIKEINNTGYNSKDGLISKLNSCGFGCRPWTKNNING